MGELFSILEVKDEPVEVNPPVEVPHIKPMLQHQDSIDARAAREWYGIDPQETEKFSIPQGEFTRYTSSDAYGMVRIRFRFHEKKSSRIQARHGS